MKRFLICVLITTLLISAGCNAPPLPTETTAPAISATTSTAASLDTTAVSASTTSTTATSAAAVTSTDTTATASTSAATVITATDTISQTSSPHIGGVDVPVSAIGNGFDTPEDAAKAYLESLRDADFNRMISVNATERYVENYDLEAQIKRIRAFNTVMALPNANDFITSLNLNKSRKTTTESIASHYLTLCAFESGLDISQLQGITQVQDIEKLMDAPDLSELKVLGFIPQEKLSILGKLLGISNFSEQFYNEKVKSNLDKIAKTDGADRADSCVAVFQIGGNNYLQFFETYEYSGRWYISQFGGILGSNVTSAVRLFMNLQGLMPLFHVSIYTGINEADISLLNISALALMDSVESSPAASSAKNSPADYKSAGFVSPEAAVKAYLEGLRDSELDRMLSTFALELYESANSIAPFSNELSTAINRESEKQAIVGEIYAQYITICSLESGLQLENQRIEDDAEAGVIAANANALLNAPKLNTLNVLGFISPEKLSDFSKVLGGLEISPTYFDKDTQNMFAEVAKNAGVDKLAGSIAVFEINGSLYLHCSDVIEYDGKWFIGQLGGIISSFLNLNVGWMGLVPVSAMAEAGIEGVDVNAVRELMK